MDLFKQGAPAPPLVGPFTGKPAVEVVLGRVNREQGLRQVDSDDGRTVPAVVAGQECRETRLRRGRPLRLLPGGRQLQGRTADEPGGRGGVLRRRPWRDLAPVRFGRPRCGARPPTSRRPGRSLSRARRYGRPRRSRSIAPASKAATRRSDFRLAVAGADLPVRRVVVKRSAER